MKTCDEYQLELVTPNGPVSNFGAANAAGVLVISADTRRTPPYQIFRAGFPGP